MSLYGGIEAGGTKFVCAVGSNPDDLCVNVIETTTPDETISRVIAYFKEQNSTKKLSSIGIGSFGPIDLNRNSKTYGFITSTPKLNWENVDFVGAIRSSFNIPIGFDTDVNAAAIGEYQWGAAQGLTNFIYLTIGTGIGGGGIINGIPCMVYCTQKWVTYLFLVIIVIKNLMKVTVLGIKIVLKD